ncbi:MAG: peptidylprolyl isomerase [Candidatus Bathyarchaeia archaeon]|jgi:cyclophilin family peptidyl-prolyl cis-trans isomerase
MAPKYNRKKPAQYKPKPNSSNSKKKQLLIIVGVLAIVLIIAAAYFAGGFGTNNANPSTSPTPTATATPTAAPTQTPATSNTRVVLQTNMGNITLELFDNKPITTENFLNLVAQGKYDGTVFHRIMKTFMIQGGEISGSTPTINDEIGTYNHNYKYTIAMAKTSLPNSATSGFFINTVDNSNIVYDDGTRFDDTYTAFGQVVEGQSVVDAIANVPVTTNAYGENSQPTQTVTIISATIIS